MSQLSERWIDYGFALAAAAASVSKDPSTKVGAVILAPDKTVVSTGFNGLPRGMPDYPAWLENREDKYDRIIHAEMNAILVARRSLVGCSLFVTPLMCCPRCAVHVAQAGITHVYAHVTYETVEQEQRWDAQHLRAESLLIDCGVEIYCRFTRAQPGNTSTAGASERV